MSLGFQSFEKCCDFHCAFVSRKSRSKRPLSRSVRILLHSEALREARLRLRRSLCWDVNDMFKSDWFKMILIIHGRSMDRSRTLRKHHELIWLILFELKTQNLPHGQLHTPVSFLVSYTNSRRQTMVRYLMVKPVIFLNLGAALANITTPPGRHTV